MNWLWTDGLAALLIEHDGVAAGELLGWLNRPTAHRLLEGQDPLAAARLLRAEESGLAGALAAAS
jgi:hypothetical protein